MFVCLFLLVFFFFFTVQDGSKCLVKWAGFGLEEATWEDSTEIKKKASEKFAFAFSQAEIRLKLTAAEAQPLKK
jgi:cell division protein FtsL